MFLRLLSPSRSARALVPCRHANRFHDARVTFRSPATPSDSICSRFRSRHTRSLWRMTRPITMANSAQSLYLFDRFGSIRARVDYAQTAAVHSSARRSLKLGGCSSIPTSLSSLRLFSSRASRGAMDSATDYSDSNNNVAADASGLEDGRRNPLDVDDWDDTVPLGMPVQDGSLDPESEEDVPVKAAELEDALTRPPAVNSGYLPLPWKGRLGYACLNTYLRYSIPPTFCSRTCRIASILENRHPLQDPSQPPHPTKNRPDRKQPPDVARGQTYVESLGLANARDVIKLLRWNDKYGIKFMRLSSEMFPFASHKEYGYKLAPFASDALGEVGRVVGDLGHRVTVHPGQFTQLGSPRKEVVEASFRDLEYHSEMLQLLELPLQQNRDAVMILHMGGVFGDKHATLDRFRENYAKLSDDVKRRLVLENDDVSWSVHDLLPICEELNIPLVLDFHHHNIIYDESQVREGTLDIMSLYDRIKATWTRKNITQKMHYSEPVPSAITKSQRRKHSDRVATMPPCDPTMDLMIEAKDKEQAVFELMRMFKLPGFDLFNDIIPYNRSDENKPYKPPRKSPKKKSGGFVDLEALIPPPQTIPDEEVGMGGPERRVYWPVGMEEWLRPKKVIRAKAATGAKKGGKAAKSTTTSETANGEEPEHENGIVETTAETKPKTPTRKGATRITTKKTTKATSKKRKASESPVSTPPESEEEPAEEEPQAAPAKGRARRSGRTKKVNYAEESESG